MTPNAATVAKLLTAPSTYLACALVIFVVARISIASRDRHQGVVTGTDLSHTWLEQILIVLAAAAVLVLVLALSAILHAS